MFFILDAKLQTSQKTKSREHRAGMARSNGTTERSADKIKLGGGSALLIMSLSDRITRKHKTVLQITLADDSTMHADKVDRRNIETQAHDCRVTISLSNTLIASDTDMRFLCVPLLTKKDIRVTTTPSFAVTAEISDELYGRGRQHRKTTASSTTVMTILTPCQAVSVNPLGRLRP